VFQVRVFIPSMGVFKGVLMRKPGITKIQLTPSMRKVPCFSQDQLLSNPYIALT